MGRCGWTASADRRQKLPVVARRPQHQPQHPIGGVVRDFAVACYVDVWLKVPPAGADDELAQAVLRIGAPRGVLRRKALVQTLVPLSTTSAPASYSACHSGCTSL